MMWSCILQTTIYLLEVWVIAVWGATTEKIILKRLQGKNL